VKAKRTDQDGTGVEPVVFAVSPELVQFGDDQAGSNLDVIQTHSRANGTAPASDIIAAPISTLLVSWASSVTAI